MTAEVAAPSWQRPPFAPGHLLSLHHGAWSERTVAPRAREIVEDLLAFARQDGTTVAYLLDPSYGLAVRAWAQACARCDLLEEKLLEHEEGCPNGCARCMSWTEQLRRFAGTRLQWTKELGLTPLQRTKLQKDGAQAAAAMYDLEKVRESGKATRPVEGVTS